MPTPIDDYIAAFPAAVRKILRAVRTTIRQAAPDAVESISYRIPTFKLDGRPLVYFAGFKNHIGMYPPVKNAVLKKAAARYAGDKGNLRFPLDEKIPHTLIARIVRSKVKDAAPQASMMAGKRHPTENSMRKLKTFLLTAVVALFSSSAALALQQPQAAPPAAKAGPMRACSLLTRAEVKKLLPWPPQLEQFPNEEEPIGTTGSSCGYPTVFIQVLPFSQRMIDSAKQRDKLEPVSGVGDEAYFHDNKNRYAELYVKTGKYLLTLQGDVPTGKTSESIKPAVVALARLLAERVR
jgi:uncharacterized protein YdhG (YjbR/CyaY superfamily)